MKLFISHATTDHALALELKQLISTVTMGLAVTWLSSATDGLRPGDNLWNEIHQNLNESDQIVALLTPNSIQRPWILYESGYVAGNKKANVIPILFSVAKQELPLPLSAYVTYSADDRQDLTHFLTQIVAEIAPMPNRILIDSSVATFYEQTGGIKCDLDRLALEAQRLSSGGDARESTKMLDKLKASEVLHQKLIDPDVSSVTIIGYTNEVESGSITHYRVRGTKTIEVFKRSIVSDLREQQCMNIVRIQNGRNTGLWNKRGKQISATARLEEEFAENDTVKITHYFYDGPPNVRAYIFDGTEALISYYETAEDVIACKGSVYKGMGDSQSMWVTDQTVYGQFLLTGLKEQVRSLRLRSRSWDRERFILSHPELCLGSAPMPTMGLSCVFFDMDGILYDSMPHYEQAWCTAFAGAGVRLGRQDPYEHESRSSEETVDVLYTKYCGRKPTKEEVEGIIRAKNDTLDSLGKPPIMSGAHKLLEAVSASGAEIYVVTSSKRTAVLDGLVTDFGGLIGSERIITGNDFVVGKPNPAPYLAACRLAGCTPVQALAIENSPLGIIAARRAGINCLAINTGPLANGTLVEAGASAVFTDCDQLSGMWPDIRNSFDL